MKWITELIVNGKTIQFKESKGEELHNLSLSKDLLDRTQKGKKKTNYVSLTINSLFFQKHW